MFLWKEEYCIDIEIIDEQHEEIFNIANRIYNLLKNDVYLDKYNKIVNIIEELKEHIVMHFTTEEEYLLEAKYKKFFSHKIEHDDFIKKLNDIDLQKIDNEEDDYIKETFDFVLYWIVKHILKTDKDYVNIVR